MAEPRPRQAPGPIFSDLPSDLSEPRSHLGEYWRRNVRYLVALLSVWFVASYGFGILLRGWLDQFRIPGTGFKLGFWFAQHLRLDLRLRRSPDLRLRRRVS